MTPPDSNPRPAIRNPKLAGRLAQYLPRISTSSPSLRTRLVIASTAACLAAFTIAGLLLYISLRDSLYRQYDDALDARATALASLVEQQGNQIHINPDPAVMSSFGPNQRRHYFEVRSESGDVIAKSPSLGADRIPTTQPATQPGTVARLDASLPNGRDARIITKTVLPKPDEDHPPTTPPKPVTLVVAGDTKRVEDAMFRLAKQLTFICGGATLGAAVALWFLISRQLRPVTAVAEQISRVGREDLSERLDPDPEIPSELLPVVTRLNEMLARLGSAFEREKAFTADVAHELRTPISALETALEISGSRLREPQAYRQTVGQCLRTVRDMHALVDRLLTLARADARQLTVRPRPVDLRPFIEETWDALASRAARRGITLDLDLPKNATLTTDPDLLKHIVQNALDNAISYAPQESTITARFTPPSPSHARHSERSEESRPSNHQVPTTPRGTGDPPVSPTSPFPTSPLPPSPSPSLHFLNPAPDLTPEQAAHVFDRFWRADHARQSGHVGLGLPLCQKLMQSLHGSAAVSLDPPGTFHLALTFPG